MEKIKWDLAKEKFNNDIHSVIICGGCGWLVSNPNLDEKNPRSSNNSCPNCLKKYKDTKSVVQKIEKTK